MKKQDAPQYVRELFKVLLDISYRHDISRVFDDFLTLVTCCYAWQTKEDEYFETIERYSKEEINKFCKALAELVIIYGQRVSAKSWTDPLGTMYEVISSNYKKSNFGQFFTPESVCTMMAQMTGAKPTDETQFYNDPCVGSGRLPLAASRANPNILVFAEDLDPVCCKMAAINLMFHGVKAQISNLNSISLDRYYRGYLVNWNYSESKVFSCLDLPENKSHTWLCWQARAKTIEAQKEMAGMTLNLF